MSFASSWEQRNYGSTPINVSSADPTTIVAGTSGKQIWVHSFIIIGSPGNIIIFEDEDGTDLFGPVTIGDTGGFVSGFNPTGHFRVPAGKDLNLNNSSAAQVGGGIQYTI